MKYILLDLFFLAVGLLGFGAVLAVVRDVTQAPSEWTAWAKLAIGLPLGGWAGVVGIALVAGRLVRQVHPSRLAGDRTELHVIVWNTWEGLWDGFRRSDRRIPRSQVRGVAFSVGQGGDTQLFLLHSSGLSLGTGWSGTRVEGMLLKEKILSWLSN